MREPLMEEVASYLREHGKRATMTMSLLGKLNPFIQAINSPIGKELLKDDIDRHEELLKKLYLENITPQETAEFRYLKLRLEKVYSRINEYIRGTNEITNSKLNQGGK